MAFDNLALAKIVQGLDQALKGAFFDMPYALGVNQYALPFHRSAYLEASAKGRGILVLYLDPSRPFVSYSTGKFLKTVDNTPFFNSLRRLCGTQVVSVTKEEGERVVTVKVKNVSQELGDLNEGYDLVLELFPSRPNAILVSLPSRKIVSVFREAGDITSARFLARNALYSYPPARPVFDAAIPDLAHAKPLLANETYRRLSLLADKEGFEAAKAALLADKGLYFAKGTILPSAFGDPSAKPVAIGDIYACFVADQRDAAKALKERDLTDKIKRALKNAQRKLKNLQEDYALSQKRLAYKDYGNLLFLYQTEYKPGMTSMTLEGQAIPLDPHKNVIENANLYFRKYHKAKQAVVTLKELEAKTQDEIEYLGKKLLEIPSGTARDLMELKEELVFQGYLKDPSRGRKALKRKKAYQPHILTTEDGVRIGYGGNGLQNETLTFQIAQSHDLFFHIKDYPGSHVVILDGKREDSDALLAAELALYLSGKDSGDVMETEKKFVKKNPTHIGLVNVLKYSTIHLSKIRPASLALFNKVTKKD